MHRSRLKLLTVAAGAVVVAAIGGCNVGQREGDLENGRALFVERCGTCHQLAEAATTAEVGPDLDAAFADARASGMDDDTIKGVTLKQIGFPSQPPGPNPEADPTFMPADLVTGDDAVDVAFYVGQVAGVPGIEPPTVAGGPGAQVFANNGCGACHILAAAGSEGTTGPDLDEALQGQSPDQVERSIVDPDAEITQGFPGGVMPTNYGDIIAAEDLELLVEFLLGQSGGGQQGGQGGSGGQQGGQGGS